MELMGSPSLAAPDSATMMGVMDSPPRFFEECVAPLGGPDAFPEAFHRYREAMYDQSRLKFYDGLFVPPASRASNTPMPRSSLWDRPDANETGAVDTGNQPMFVDPKLYTNDGTLNDGTLNDDALMGFPMQAGDTYSPSPGSQPSSSRRPSSIKSEFHQESQSGSASTDMPPFDPLPQGKRKPRGTRRASNAPQDAHKRLKFLERNRLAASKCREKKKVFVSELEEKKADLERKNLDLQAEQSRLIREVAGLKHLLMAHAECREPTIDSWLANEARRFAQIPGSFGAYHLPVHTPPVHPPPPLGVPLQVEEQIGYDDVDPRHIPFNL